MKDFVSIVIPAYNKADWTIKTVESVLAQTYPQIEIIVVDDGSTDDTPRAMERFAGRIRYVRKANGGACSARNLGIKEGKGEFVGFLDCDDLYLPQKVEESVCFLKQNPLVGMVHTAAYFIDEQDQVTGRYSHPKSRTAGWIAKRLAGGNYICNSTVLLRRECLDKTGLFDESIFSPADWDLWLRVAEQYPIGYIDQPLTQYRVCGNYIFKHVEEAREEELQVLNNFFSRNAQYGVYLKRDAFSALHLRYAQCFFIKNNREEMKKEFFNALQVNPWNMKALALGGYFLLAPASLEAVLKRKILRYAE